MSHFTEMINELNRMRWSVTAVSRLRCASLPSPSHLRCLLIGHTWTSLQSALGNQCNYISCEGVLVGMFVCGPKWLWACVFGCLVPGPVLRKDCQILCLPNAELNEGFSFLIFFFCKSHLDPYTDPWQWSTQSTCKLVEAHFSEHVSITREKPSTHALISNFVTETRVRPEPSQLVRYPKKG